jgi:NAD(P)-dependent dehydrogenase (short-subunit alcohol dehydrogenase family)
MNIPDQSGKIVIVTGANSGLGYESARALAKKGAHVVMTSRSIDKGNEARDAILKEAPNAALDVMALDLGSLDSVRNFAEAFKAKYDSLHILMNNAGVMAPPYGKTTDGFEMQFGVNHLGHFALTGLLLDRILETPGARVVTVSSNAQYLGSINFDDLQSEKKYERYPAYYQSKLANVLFAFELQRYFEKIGADAISVATHPGLSRTKLQSTAVEKSGNVLERIGYVIWLGLQAQKPSVGVRSQVYAATMPDVNGCDHVSPKYFKMRGAPVKNAAAKAAHDEAAAKRLWDISEQLTGVRYEVGETVAV